ncbi:uncharacterized protein ISCGN_018172 [Ixodes scapularis]
MCKLFERIVLARITWIAEDRKLFHAAQTGFRQHLGTRDSLLLLSTDVYRKGSTCSLVAVDICKAFDLLPHEAIVKALREGGITHKPLNFVKGFLKQRKYSIKTGDIRGPLRNNNIGVPQGAVISPILFDLTMAPLAWRLNKISTLKGRPVWTLDVSSFCAPTLCGLPLPDCPSASTVRDATASKANNPRLWRTAATSTQSPSQATDLRCVHASASLVVLDCTKVRYRSHSSCWLLSVLPIAIKFFLYASA